MLLGTSSQQFIRTDSSVAINLRPLYNCQVKVGYIEMSSFSQESSVGNEVLVEKGKDSRVEIEEAVKNRVIDGAAATKQTSNNTSGLLGGRLFMLCEVMVPASIMVVIVGLFLIPTIYYALPESTTVQVRT